MRLSGDHNVPATHGGGSRRWGNLIDPADPQGAATAIAKGLEGHEQLRAAGFQNLKRFDEEAIADQYCAFYESILDGD